MRAEGIVRHELGCDFSSKGRSEAARNVNGRHLIVLVYGIGCQLLALAFQIGTLAIGLRADGHVFASGHRHGTCRESRGTGNQDALGRCTGRRNAKYQTGSRDKAIVRTEYGRPEPSDTV